MSMIEGLTKRQQAPLALIAVIIGVTFIVAFLIPDRPTLAIALTVIAIAASFALINPTPLFVAAFVTVYAYWRVGPSQIDVSISDAVTGFALIAAIPHAPWQSPALRRILQGLACYLGLLTAVVAANPTPQAIGDWFHRALLFGGAIVIGATVAHRNQIALVLRAFILTSCVVSAAAVADTLTNGLQSAYPLGIHKNAAGPLLAIALILLLVAPRTVGLSAASIRGASVILLFGLLATQSRGAALALFATIAVWALRNQHAKRRGLVIFALIAAVTLLTISAVTLRENINDNPRFNSVAIRQETYADALSIWRQRPLLGGGLRYFNSARTVTGAPHNLVVSELSEAGILGTVGTLALFGLLLAVLRRRRDPIGQSAYLALFFYLLFGLTGIFWLAGALTLPMLMIGLALGETDESARDPLSAALHKRSRGKLRPFPQP